MLYHKKNYKGINSNDEIKYMKNYSKMHIVLTNYITNITFM